MSESTAYQYLSRLKDFENFIGKEYAACLDLDSLLPKLKQGNQDPYNLLNSYAAYLKNRNISALTLKQRIVTAKNFLEYCNIDISTIIRSDYGFINKITRNREETASIKYIAHTCGTTCS
jgi:integrase